MNELELQHDFENMTSQCKSVHTSIHSQVNSAIDIGKSPASEPLQFALLMQAGHDLLEKSASGWFWMIWREACIVFHCAAGISPDNASFRDRNPVFYRELRDAPVSENFFGTLVSN
ncbi:MAG: hypothetical protein JNJ77_01090 [Planctomycetia bacterium]|nr:hypothetical protein [Planctomycetia bacterium]